MKFVQLGERQKNGRIGKNEQYTLEEFRNIVETVRKVHEPWEVPGFLERLSKKKVYDAMNCSESIGYWKGYRKAFEDMEENIIKAINSDNFGRK